MWRTTPPALLAQVTIPVDVVVPAAVVMGLLLLGAFAIYQARRWYDTTAEPEEADLGLEEYRRLADEGLLDPAEFERIRARLQRPADDPDPPAGPPPGDPTGIRPGPPPGRPSTDIQEGPTP